MAKSPSAMYTRSTNVSLYIKHQRFVARLIPFARHAILPLSLDDQGMFQVPVLISDPREFLPAVIFHATVNHSSNSIFSTIIALGGVERPNSLAASSVSNPPESHIDFDL